ncbi:MAG: PilN domain-containing protein [Longimicrobiales bacterium]|nr:PilN domain-containing protein [Longimicrobiales bacterium]
MIEINLLPGAEKRKKRGGGGFSLKLGDGLPEFNRITAFIVVAWILAPLLGLYLYFGVQNRKADLQVAIDQAVADSIRFSQLIQTQASLRARQDTIAQKLALIQEIDAGRYIWPHILDEVSRALPPYTWLDAIDQVQGGPTPTFEVEGRTGSLPALTRFMDALEASPFLRNVQLISSEQAQVGNDPNNIVNEFVLRGTYEPPPMEMVETVPLFPNETAATTTGSEVGNGAGTP